VHPGGVSTPPPGLPPALDPRGRERPLRRLAASIPAVLGLVVLLGSGGAYIYVNQQFGNIKKIAGLCLAGCGGNPGSSDTGGNYLLVGSDTRAGANSQGNLKGVAEPGGAGGGYGNSDTTLLVHIPRNHQHVTVISFPRDMKVTLPTYKDKAGKSHGGTDAKFNEAFSVGGPSLLVKQVSQVSGLPIDHYVGIDFAGFQKMVDAVGGVQVCLAVPAFDPGGDGSGGSGFKSPAGRVTLTGERALQFVRQRHGLPRGDLDRIGRQQRFLSDLGAKVKSAGTLLNPIKVDGLLTALTDSVSIDSGTSKQDLINLAQALRNLDPSRVAFSTVPTNGGGQSAIGAYLAEDTPKAQALFASVREDTPAPAGVGATALTPASTRPSPAAPADVPAADPRTVTVRVENGTGVRGQAAQVAGLLTKKGFRISGTGTRRGAGLTSPQVRYGAGALGAAKAVAAAVPGSSLLPDAALGARAVTLVTATATAPAKRPDAAAQGATTAAPAPAGGAQPLASDCGP